jgi:hypothetical protein
MRRVLWGVLLGLCAARAGAAAGSYLFVWAGDADAKASDFLGVIDADPKSPGYGKLVASLPVGDVGTYPHHTEHEMPANGHLLANGFGAGKTWLFDLTRPLEPRILASFGDLAGFSHPHTFIRLPNGNVMATFQYLATPASVPMAHHHGGSTKAEAESKADAPERATGGLVEIDEAGRVIRSAAASDPAIADMFIYPYSVLPLPAIDRAVSTTTDMNDRNVKATSQWVQFWRWSDLKLLRSIALPPGPGGKEQQFTGEPRLLADGKSVYIHTFNCGLYLLRDIDRPEPTARFVHAFEGTNCGVPVLTGSYWLQPVPDVHALVALDIANPEAPREVSRVAFGDDEAPHWIAIDPTGRRVVLNSAGSKGNRLFVIDLDRATGKLAIDPRFRDAGDSRAGVDLTGKTWPHGFTGKAMPHGTVFSR